MTTQRSYHEWYLNSTHCRQCGLIAIGPEERLLGDLLVPCLWPNSYDIHTLPAAVKSLNERKAADELFQKVYDYLISRTENQQNE